MNKKVYIVGGLRSPILKIGSYFKNLGNVELSTILIRDLLKKYNLDKSEIDELIVGNVIGAAQGQNIARQIALSAHFREEISAFTVNNVCGSGMKAIELAFNSILLGESEIVIAGGSENMSRAPYYLPLNTRIDGLKFGDFNIQDSILRDALIDTIYDIHMGITAENLAEKFKINREEQDEYAYYSHKKALNAIDNAYLRDEILTIESEVKKNLKVKVERDEQVREDINLEALSRLKAAFLKNGTVTAGNSSSLNDGSCYLILASEDKVKKLNLKPLSLIEGFTSIGCDPKYMGLGAYFAIEKLIKKLKINPKNVDFLEVNEAFSAQFLAVFKLLRENFDFNIEQANIWGGALSLGHPFGMSGARITLTLARQLKEFEKNLGIASICIGGGQGMAILLRNVFHK